MAFTKEEQREYDEGLAEGYSPCTMTANIECRRGTSQAKTEQYTDHPSKSVREPEPSSERFTKKEEKEGKTIDEIAEKDYEVVKSGASKLKKTVTSSGVKQALKSTFGFFGAMGRQARSDTRQDLRSEMIEPRKQKVVYVKEKPVKVIKEQIRRPFSGMDLISTLGGGSGKPFQGMSLIHHGMGLGNSGYTGASLMNEFRRPVETPKKSKYVRKAKKHTATTPIKKRKYTKVSKKRYVKTKKTQKRR